MMHWGGDGWGWGWPGWILMAVSMLAFWGLLAGLVVMLFRWGGRSGSGEGRADEPERILAERFARGDIDDEEYRRRLDVLRGTPHRPAPGEGTA